MHWRLGAAICLIRGHDPVLMTRPTLAIYCLRCGVVLHQF